MHKFPRMLTALRKERGLSQKNLAAELNVSQALLSHYERGIRECGLDFLLAAADYFQVSCDYLLGRTAERSVCKPAKKKASAPVKSAQSKKMLLECAHVLYSIMEDCKNPQLLEELNHYLFITLYRILHTLSLVQGKEKQETPPLFSIHGHVFEAVSDNALRMIALRARCALSGGEMDGITPVSTDVSLPFTREELQIRFPQSAPALFSLIKNAETAIRQVHKV